MIGAVFCSVALSRAQAACPGDCDGDSNIAINELISGVGLVLGGGSVSACSAFDQDRNDAVSINELVAAVNRALSGCDPSVPAAGLCLAPGATGLIPCAQNTEVRVLRCDDPTRCLSDPNAYTVVDIGRAGADGRFAFQLDAAEINDATLIFEAVVDPASDISYRVIDIGPAGVSRDLGGTTAGLMEIVISPATEAAVRLLELNGLENFDADGIAAVIAAVTQANADTDFAGQTPAGAATLAVQVAAADPVVQMTIIENRATPTPTPTNTGPPPPSTHTPTNTPTATATPTPTETRDARGSIIVYENLQVDDFDSSLVSFANESFAFANARCFYVNRNSHCSGNNLVCRNDGECPQGESCMPGCSALPFSVAAPLFSVSSWTVAFGNGDSVPPVPEVPFSGDLVCVEVDASGSPISGNHISGVQRAPNGTRSAALPVLGNELNDGDTALALGVEYDGCPASIDPARIANCWSQSGLTFTCGTPGPTATPTATPIRAVGSILAYTDLDVADFGDATVSIGNASNSLVSAYCFYARSGCDAVTEFTVVLPRQSSLSWDARGGIQGRVPRLHDLPFSGELVCVQIDAADFELSGNAIYGSVQPLVGPPVDADALDGNFNNNGDGVLCLGAAPAVECQFGAEYDDCPAAVAPGQIASCWSQSAFTFECP